MSGFDSHGRLNRFAWLQQVPNPTGFGVQIAADAQVGRFPDTAQERLLSLPDAARTPGGVNSHTA